jgi:pyruvate dehydrogenase E2 component (dihydrolipoamide acetyltransferase)
MQTRLRPQSAPSWSIAVADNVHALIMPKYGMVMTEGRVSSWRREVGDTVDRGDELLDIETEKVANVYESPVAGILRRKLALDGESVPIGGLFGVIASSDAGDSEVDAFVKQFEAEFARTGAALKVPSPEVTDIEQGYIRALQSGEGSETPLVLIHGFSGDLTSWILNQGALGDGRTVYAVDLPGHGGSVKDPALAAVPEMAAALGNFLKTKGLSQVHLVGHSLGGAVAAQLALHNPETIASLTLIAPAGLGKEINGSFIKGMIEAPRRKEMQLVLETLFYDPALVSRDMAMNVLKSKRIDGAVECLRAVAARCFPGDAQAFSMRDELTSLRLPVQVIWGEADRIIPAAHATNLPGTIKVHRLEKAGHMAHMEKAADVNRLILGFIAAN